MTLVHVSEQPIQVFEPRPSPERSSRPGELLVWAIDRSTIARQLLPRDCPRVYARRGAATTAEDAAGLLGDDEQVMWIHPTWEARCRSTHLYIHTLPAATFELEDAPAGYHVSPLAVRPTAVEHVPSPLNALAALGVVIRRTDDLRAVAAAVAGSTLEFSIIRLHDAP